MTDQGNGDTFWDRISRINVSTCKQCGSTNPLGSRECEECGAALPVDDDDVSVEVREGPAPGRIEKAGKIALEDSKNLNALRRASEGILSGSMDREQYQQIVSKVLYVSQTGVMVFETDLFKSRIAELPSEEGELAQKQYQGFKKFNEGVTMMSKYLETGNADLVKKGFQMAEAAMIELDRIQDRQLEIVNLRKQG